MKPQNGPRKKSRLKKTRLEPGGTKGYWGKIRGDLGVKSRREGGGEPFLQQNAYSIRRGKWGKPG